MSVILLYECVFCMFLFLLVLVGCCMIWHEWFMSSCSWCVNNQRLEHLSSSLSLSLYLFIRSDSFSLSLSLFPQVSLSLSTWTLWIRVITARKTGHVYSCCFFSLLFLSPSPHILLFSPLLSLSLSLPFSLRSLVSSCPWFVSKSFISYEEGEEETPFFSLLS